MKNISAQGVTGTKATRTDPLEHAPMFAPHSGNRCISGAIPDKTSAVENRDDATGDDCKVKRGKPLSISDDDGLKAGERTRTVNIQLGRLVLYH